MRIEPGQRWTSNIGAPALVVLEKATNLDGAWLVRSETDGVMTTIDEAQLLDDYDPAEHTTGSRQARENQDDDPPA